MLLPAAFACVLVVTCIVPTPEAGTVVMIPFPFTSHTKYHTHVARALSTLGHEVWLTMPTYLSEKGHLDTSGFNVIPFETLPNMEADALRSLSGNYFEGKPVDVFAFLHICKDTLDAMLINETFLATIRDKNPDLIVLDNLPSSYAMAVLPYRLGKPFAFLGSSYFAQMQRIPFSPAEIPVNIFPYSNRMTFFQRVATVLMYMLMAVYNPSMPTDAVSTYAPEMPYLPLDRLVAQAELWLVEMDHILDYPKPTLPNVKLIGGTACGPAKRLPPEFRSFMDDAPQGVVIVSFGSYVLDLPEDISDKILHVLLQLPMKSVFRSKLTSPDPEKILTSPWIPQNDLLGHPNTKVFVSHCGKNGQYEALYHAVPVVATPMFMDQAYNVERVRVKGFAEVLDLRTCSADQLTSAILRVAREPGYKQAVTKYSRLFRQLYGTPMETAAFWLDHVMEHGGDYMRSAGQEMPFYQFLLLDVLLFLVSVLALAAGALGCCCCFLYKRVCHKVKVE